MAVPLTIYVLFIVLSMVGGYLAAAHHHPRGRAAGVWALVIIFLFYTGLTLGLYLLLRSGGHA
ncbi:MAG TPA: hypothetical protein VEL74_09990 [Thermoanaerobaculia bacterium]|nr:hypothetical protein [Thermoanaerobaculia bacterium]